MIDYCSQNHGHRLVAKSVELKAKSIQIMLSLDELYKHVDWIIIDVVVVKVDLLERVTLSQILRNSFTTGIAYTIVLN